MESDDPRTKSAEDSASQPPDSEDSWSFPGQSRFIGPYRILRLLGEGGMGLVFEAEQRSGIRRRVALKVMKPGLNADQVLARFEAELTCPQW